MVKVTLRVVLTLGILVTTLSSQVSTMASSKLVSNAVYKDRTLNILVALAEKYKAVIGVYGTLIGDDSRIVNISLQTGTLKDVFDAMVAQDKRFVWQQNSDGSIHFLIRNSPQAVTQVLVRSFEIQDPKRMGIVEKSTQIPEVGGWLKQHNCHMEELFSQVPQDWPPFSVKSEGKPLAEVFDQIAEKSNTYFWSAIQYSNQPCAINVRP